MDRWCLIPECNVIDSYIHVRVECISSGIRYQTNKGDIDTENRNSKSNAFHQAKSRNEYQIEDTNNQRPHKNS